MPCLRSRSAVASAIAGQRTDRHQQHVGGQPVGRAPPARRLRTRRFKRRNIFAHITFREPQRGRPVADGHRLAQFLAQPGRIARRGDPHAGHDAQHRQVPHAVVAGAVGTGDPGPVEHHRHRQLVQRDIHHDLVERPVEERRVDGDHRVQSAHRQPGGRGHRVLLGDADVEQPVRVALTERRQPGRTRHRGGDRDDVATLLGQLDQFIGEGRRPARAPRPRWPARSAGRSLRWSASARPRRPRRVRSPCPCG